MFYHQSIAEFKPYVFKTNTLGERENRKALPETGKELNATIYLTEHQRQRHNRVRVVRAVDSFREQLQPVAQLRVFALVAVY